MVRIPGFHCCGLGSIPGQGTEIPQAAQHSTAKTNKQTKKDRDRKGKIDKGQNRQLTKGKT